MSGDTSANYQKAGETYRGLVQHDDFVCFTPKSVNPPLNTRANSAVRWFQIYCVDAELLCWSCCRDEFDVPNLSTGEE